MKKVFLALMVAGLMLQGCGESEPEKHVLVGKWAINSNAMADDPKNGGLSTPLLKFVILVYGRNFEIQEGPGENIVKFTWVGMLPALYGVEVGKKKSFALKNLKTGKEIQAELPDPDNLIITLEADSLRYALEKKSNKLVLIHLMRIKIKEKS
jgi:hypothetical protein